MPFQVLVRVKVAVALLARKQLGLVKLVGDDLLLDTVDLLMITAFFTVTLADVEQEGDEELVRGVALGADERRVVRSPTLEVVVDVDLERGHRDIT